MSSPVLSWMIVDTGGSPAIPAARTYATLVSYGANLYLFGGYGESKGRFNDVYEYSTPNHSWRLVPPQGEIPKPVYLHSAVQWGHQMIVMGGNSGKETNDIYYYDLDTFQWSKGASPGLFQASAMPAARYGHASCVYGAGQLLIVGGCKSNNTYFKDAWSMDLSSKKWRKLEDLPLDLAYHSLFTWQDRAYLFGGYNGKEFGKHIYVLDSLTGKWTILQCSGQQPPPMCGSATVLRGSELFVFGGYTEKGHTNELYRFNMSTRVWTLLNTTNKPLARAYLQAAVVGDRCSIFGGYDGANCISDFRSIQLPPAQGSLSSSSVGMVQPAVPFNVNANPFYSPNNIPLTNGTVTSPFNDAFFNLSTTAAVDAVLSTYSANYNDYLGRDQLGRMIAGLQQAWRSRPHHSGGMAMAGSVGQNGQTYPFDISRIPAMEGLGFTREHVLKVMARMHAAGQNTRNTDLLADMCLKYGDDDAPDSAVSLDRQNSERDKLKQKVQELESGKDEEKTCKICYDKPVSCALQDCGHLLCYACAESLKKDGDPCPFDQKPIRSLLKVFWA